VNAGITDIQIVTGGNYAGDFLQLLGNGGDFGLKDLSYTYQQGEGGIADALKLAEHFVDGDRMVIVLGDNIIQGNIKAAVESFRAQPEGAKIMLKEVPDPERFGVATVRDDGTVTKIVEKPKAPETNKAVIGIYMYDAKVFDYARDLKPSARGELEITDVNRAYLEAGELRVERLGRGVAWLDTGTYESLLPAQTFVETIQERQGLRIACLEEIAFRNGWIGLETLKKLGAEMKNSAYGDYLRRVAAGETA
jgi:glucose-1-phosphate thymidylyltransferase